MNRLYFLLLTISSISLNGQNFEMAANPNDEDTYLYELGQSFIECLNGPSPSEADVLMKTLYIPSASEGLAAQLRKEYGTLEKASIRIMPDRMSIHVVGWLPKMKAWRNFQIGFTDEAPKKGRRLAIVLAAPPTTIAEGKIEDQAILNEVNAYVDQLIEEHGLSGSLMIANDEKVLIRRTYGIADKDTGRKITSETALNLASTGKLFTTVSILRLIESGKLALEDKLIQFIPDYQNKTVAEKVTVGMLLSHQSGIGDFWDSAYEKDWDNIRSHSDYLPHIVRQPKAFEPGSRASYSNSNFILLGLIIEKVTGQDYYSHIKSTILKPLGMSNSGFFTKAEKDRVALGYLDLGDDMIRTRGGWVGSAAGGSFSTANDLMKFRNALLNYELVGKEILDLATSEQSLMDGYAPYGYGFSLNGNFKTAFGHGGLGPGAGVAFDIDKASGLTLILLSNKVNGAYSELLFTLRELLSR